MGQIDRDFLLRCNDYEICDVSVPKEDDEDDGPEVPAAVGGRPPDLAKMNREREEKIRRYREQKLLEERVGELRAAVLDAPDRADEGRIDGFFCRVRWLRIRTLITDHWTHTYWYFQKQQPCIQIVAKIFPKLRVEWESRELNADESTIHPRTP